MSKSPEKNLCRKFRCVWFCVMGKVPSPTIRNRRFYPCTGLPMTNDSEKPATFDSLPAWMTWVDIVQEHGNPNCQCSLCVALRAWIQESAGRTEMQLNELEVLAA